MIAEFFAAVLALVGVAAPGVTILQGYVEGEYLRVGSPVAGTLAELNVERGGRVAAGGPLFSLDVATARAARDEAAAQLANAEAQLADLRTGKRPEELAVIAAQKAQAEASFKLSAAELRRQETLVRNDAAAQQKLDQARANLARDQARIAELTAQYQTALLGGRDEQIVAAEAQVAQRRATLAQAEQKLIDMAPTAPQAAFVEQTFFDPGEYVPAGAPVVSLLPPDKVKLVFFVPERRLGALRIGQDVDFRCDGCAPGQKARVTFFSSQAEFTPPVIYSVGSRDKLVYRAEARPLGDPLELHPGQPVDVLPP